jgi:hypothetical protein
MGIQHCDDDLREENGKVEVVRHGHLVPEKTLAYRGEGSSDDNW